MNYVYDFGDYWEHRIKVEKTLAPDPEMELPLCVDGAGATPPEDCGGVPGYAEFVQAMADPDHAEHDNMAEWIGRHLGSCGLRHHPGNDWLAQIKL